MNVVSQHETITPAAAAGYLKKNRGNRNIRQGRVENYAAAMRRGEWLLTHQGIAFDENGDLLDGQHRLLAIIAYGKPVRMMVVRGIPRANFIALDIGATRSVTDMLGISPRDVSAARIILAMRAGPGHWKSGRASFPSSPSQVQDLMNELYEPFNLLNEHVKLTNRRNNGVTRTAAIARIMKGHGGYAIPLMRSFVAMDSNLPPVAVAMLRQMETGKASARTSYHDMLVRFWLMLDPDKGSIPTITFKDPDRHLAQIALALGWRGER